MTAVHVSLEFLCIAVTTASDTNTEKYYEDSQTLWVTLGYFGQQQN